MQTTQRYVDLDFGFPLNPVTEDVGKKVNARAINQSLKNLIMMQTFDYPFHPEIGCQIYGLLFELFTPVTAAALQRAITYCVENFEPRVKLTNVTVDNDEDNHSIIISLSYIIVNTGSPQTYTFSVDRTR